MAATGRSHTGPSGHPDDLTSVQVEPAVRSFSGLDEPSRLRILWALREAELDLRPDADGEALFHADHQVIGVPDS